LLNKGLVNDADEVKAFSLAQIQKIAKVAGIFSILTFFSYLGSLLIPHVAELVGVLLEAMSSLEPAQFNYMSFHTEKMNVSQEQLEEARIAITKVTSPPTSPSHSQVSPISDTLDLCVKYVDEKNADELTSKLAEVIKTSIGMQTKVGTARFIVSLVFTKSNELKPHTEKLLASLMAAFRDRSPSVRKAYANAIASIAKYAPARAVGKLVGQLVALYKDSEHDESRMMSATAFNELVKRSPDAIKVTLPINNSNNFKGFYVDVLPISFIGKHDPSEEIAKIFKEVFDEVSTGAPRQYLPEIVKYISVAMDAQSWIMKKQGKLPSSNQN
jgi:proteasome component ECM29